MRTLFRDARRPRQGLAQVEFILGMPLLIVLILGLAMATWTFLRKFDTLVAVYNLTAGPDAVPGGPSRRPPEGPWAPGLRVGWGLRTAAARQRVELRPRALAGLFPGGLSVRSARTVADAGRSGDSFSFESRPPLQVVGRLGVLMDGRGAARLPAIARLADRGPRREEVGPR